MGILSLFNEIKSGIGPAVYVNSQKIILVCCALDLIKNEVNKAFSIFTDEYNLATRKS